jgi:hypothetical protein
MIDPLAAAFAAGAALGMASAFHCATMCAGISAGMLALFGAGDRRRALTILIGLQAGRIASYTVMGALVGLAGSAAFHVLLDPRITAGALSWAAAVSLMWIGLTIAEVMPPFPALKGPFATLSTGADRLLAPVRRRPIAGPFSAGMSWALCPCPMVYGALFASALTASLAGGATLMAGFGLATVPAVAASALGLSGLRTLKTRAPMRTALGLAIAGIGYASVHPGWHGLAAICLTP